MVTMTSDEARSRLWWMLCLGVAAQILGGILIAAQWPSAELTPAECFALSGSECSPEELEASGSKALAGFGIAFVALGELPVLAALVGFGVRLGLAAAGPQQTIQTPTASSWRESMTRGNRGTGGSATPPSSGPGSPTADPPQPPPGGSGSP